MTEAWYMLFNRAPSLCGYSRIGGLPSHLPEIWPIHSPIDRLATLEPMCFVAQFDLSECGISISGVQYLQVFRAAVDDDPQPQVLGLPREARVNVGHEGRSLDGLVPNRIAWEKREDPPLFSGDQRVDYMTFMKYSSSKAGGTTWYPESFLPGETYLIQFLGDEVGANLANRACLIFLKSDGSIGARLDTT